MRHAVIIVKINCNQKTWKYFKSMNVNIGVACTKKIKDKEADEFEFAIIVISALKSSE